MLPHRGNKQHYKMSASKHLHSKGPQNPNSKGPQDPNSKSKNPAAGGQVRSVSSPHSPAVGNFAKGGQAPQEASALAKAIFCRITESAKEHRVRVFKTDVETFANHYASSMPGKMRKFEQSDVEQALEVFQASFQPPAPAPAPSPPPPPPPPHQRNPNNLFGHLMRSANSWGLPGDLLIRWLKWYTGQPHICPIAENPSNEDLTRGYHAMVNDISPGAEMFRKVCDHGCVSPETVGWMNFQKIMEMNPPPKNGHIWAVEKCPCTIRLQEALYFKKIGDLKHVCCFVAGICFLPDGTTSTFTREPFRRKAPLHDPNFMVGQFALVWSTKIGPFNYVHVTDHEEIARQLKEAKGTGGMYYGNGADRFGVISYRHLTTSLDGGAREVEEEFRLSRDGNFIRPDQREELPCDDKSLRSDPTYKRLANEAMAQIGGIPVSLCEGAEEAEHYCGEDSDHGGEEAKPSWGAAAGH